MKINQIHSITFDTEERIVTATLSSADELVVLLSSGQVIRHSISEHKAESLFTMKSSFSHADGGFDLEEQSTIYTMDSIVVVVNDFKRHGAVHYPGKYNSLRLWRGEYHADISRFPIALFKNEDGIPHLIYGNDWNHIQIMNLDTRQILTAAKSLIMEGAEERHIEFYKKHEESNKHSWPSPYDYFYGRLEISPNNKNFLSAGWAWGSSDAYTVYGVEDFIQNPRVSVRAIDGWEHDDRAVCWIDDETIAVACDPRVEDYDDTTKDSPNQLLFYRVNEKEVKLERKADVAGLDLVRSEIHFNSTLNSIVVVSDNVGVAIVSLEGKVLFNDPEMKQDAYFPALNLFVKTDNTTISIHQLLH